MTSRASTLRRRAPGSSVARRDRRNVCDRGPLGDHRLSIMRTLTGGSASVWARGTTTSSGGALAILEDTINSGAYIRKRERTYLIGAAHDDAAFKSKEAMRKEGVENILCSECMDQPRASMRKKIRRLETNGLGQPAPTR